MSTLWIAEVALEVVVVHEALETFCNFAFSV
jgi:hypothetical protein